MLQLHRIAPISKEQLSAQYQSRGIYRVFFFTGPALKVLSMELVPPKKEIDFCCSASEAHTFNRRSKSSVCDVGVI